MMFWRSYRNKRRQGYSARNAFAASWLIFIWWTRRRRLWKE